MVAINFDGQFAKAVAAGEKRQTVRRQRKPRPIVAGDRLQLYTAQRTKKSRKLADAVCTGTEMIEIDDEGVFLGGRFLSADDREAFAQADGFPDYAAMRDWFSSKSGLPFEGVVIRWDLDP